VRFSSKEICFSIMWAKQSGTLTAGFGFHLSQNCALPKVLVVKQMSMSPIERQLAKVRRESRVCNYVYRQRMIGLA
jgi:hypothetical protein